ncbi:helix-turn-helix domain-containing protein [Sphingopyxis sp. 2PD]|uniref:helix-turn-helix domain-containing protein n=1 Tax=Sphingopyxis sp. 2PD TaxID=2502196 RepID=UPI0010FA0CAE|nr:helix-turn-helix domain-containing protein [Sphingopyxis sp. 2PD]
MRASFSACCDFAIASLAMFDDEIAGGGIVMEPIIGDIDVRMARLKANHNRLETVLKSLNEPEVSDKIEIVLGVLFRFIERHEKIDIHEIWQDALNVHSLVSMDQIDSDLIDKPADHPTVIAQDRIISISNECLAIANTAKGIIESNTEEKIEVSSSELIEKKKFSEDIDRISGRINDLEKVLQKAVENEKSMKSGDRHLTNLADKLSININTIKISIDVGEIIDLAVVERSVKSIYSAIQDAGISIAKYIRSVPHSVLDLLSKIRATGNKLVESTHELLVSVREEMQRKRSVSDARPPEMPQYNKEWIDNQFKVIGKMIHEERRKLKIEISAFSSNTRIKIEYLRMIENGELHSTHLKPVYVLGFTRTYLRYLSMDEHNLMKGIKNYKYYYQSDS